MIGAKSAMPANTRTMPNPRTPRRLCRRVDHDVRANRRTLRPIVSPRDLHWLPPASETMTVSDPDTGIEDSVEQVRNDVSEDHHNGNEKEDGTGKEPILGRDRDKEERSESVVGEDVLQDDRAPDDEAETDREGRDDRKVGVPPGVSFPHGPFRQSLGLRREDEVFPHHLEHGGLHEEDDSGR